MLFKNKYRIESTRLKDWDYSNPWWYYITINTKSHVEYFGKINNNKVELNEFGNIVSEEWVQTKNVRKNVELDYFIIMPNHLHGIIILKENVETTGSVVSKNEIKINETTQRVVSTTLKHDSLGSIIGQFKSICTKRIHESGNRVFAWQKGFYDRIIRSEKELYRVRKYIMQNPLKWELEKELVENINL